MLWISNLHRLQDAHICLQRALLSIKTTLIIEQPLHQIVRIEELNGAIEKFQIMKLQIIHHILIIIFIPQIINEVRNVGLTYKNIFLYGINQITILNICKQLKQANIISCFYFLISGVNKA